MMTVLIAQYGWKSWALKLDTNGNTGSRVSHQKLKVTDKAAEDRYKAENVRRKCQRRRGTSSS
jgi:hypothetical protein